MKETNRFYFTVEGETEEWYFAWLQNKINNVESRSANAKIVAKKQTPMEFLKSASIQSSTEVTHVFDCESNAEEHVKCFEITLSEMKRVTRSGKDIRYRLGYSNFDFELWIILHKRDCFGSLSDRKQYLKYINSAYGEKFSHLNDYKTESHFKKILSKISLPDVKAAIHRAESITQQKQNSGNLLQKKYGYEWYPDNPALSVHESIKGILKACGIN